MYLHSTDIRALKPMDLVYLPRRTAQLAGAYDIRVLARVCIIVRTGGICIFFFCPLIGTCRRTRGPKLESLKNVFSIVATANYTRRAICNLIYIMYITATGECAHIM